MIGFILASAGALTLTATAATPLAVGRQIAEMGGAHGSPACVSCHGAALQGQPALKAPALAGLSSQFILQRLAHYAGPDGHNAYMRQVAASLDPSERQAVAAYLSSLPKPK